LNQWLLGRHGSAKPIIEGFLASPSKALSMPIYAYKCDACGHAKDVLQKMSDDSLTDCPVCGAPKFNKQLTAPGFQLKGTGWYATDFKGGGAATAVPAAAATADAVASPAPAAAPSGGDTSGTSTSASSAGACAASCACH
jgi:putative FmdB family regulatory protein